MRRLTYGSVCSGIDAASVAWEPLGWTPAFFSEIDPFPRAVLAHRFPRVPIHGDFTTIKDGSYAAIDVLVGGTPCQSFSVAGLRGGLDDDRGNLALEYLRLADRLRPRWVVWENVPGVLSSNGGRDFGSILGGLAELGYGFAYRVLDAQFFGVPQRRRRVFVVGYLGDWRPAAAVLFERHSLQGHSPPRREAGQRPAPTLAARTRGGGGLGTDFDLDGGLIASPIPIGRGQAGVGFGSPDGMLAETVSAKWAKGTGGPAGDEAYNLVAFNPVQGGMSPSDVCPPIGASSGGGNQGAVCITGDVTHALNTANNGKGSSEDGTGRGVPTVAVSVALRGQDGGGTAELGGDIANALRASQGGGDKPHVLAFAQNQRDEVRLMDVSGALAAEPGMKQQTFVAFHGSQDPDVSGDVTHPVGRNQGQETCALVGAAVRRLTPRECERLQGLPDDWTLVSYRGKPASDGPRYKAIGNSMAVPVMRWIGERIAAVDAIVGERG